MALLTPAEAIKYVPALAGTSEDTDLATFVARAGSLLATKMGYPAVSVAVDPTAESTTYTRYFDGRGGRDLVLDVWPVTGITTIEDDATLDFDGSTYLVAGGDYATFKETTVRLTSTAAHGAWSNWDANEVDDAIKVVFTAGYSTVPEWLKHAAGLTLKHLWANRKTQGKATRSGKGGSRSLTAETIPKVALEIIASHTLPMAVF